MKIKLCTGMTIECDGTDKLFGCVGDAKPMMGWHYASEFSVGDWVSFGLTWAAHKDRTIDTTTLTVIEGVTPEVAMSKSATA